MDGADVANLRCAVLVDGGKIQHPDITELFDAGFNVDHPIFLSSAGIKRSSSSLAQHWGSSPLFYTVENLLNEVASLINPKGLVRRQIASICRKTKHSKQFEPFVHFVAISLIIAYLTVFYLVYVVKGFVTSKPSHFTFLL